VFVGRRTGAAATVALSEALGGSVAEEITLDSQKVLDRIVVEIDGAIAGLEKASDGRPVLRIAAVAALKSARLVVIKASDGLRDADIVERQVVYRMVAAALAGPLKTTEGDLYEAIATLCGEDAASPVRSGIAQPRPELLARVESEVVHISVQYSRKGAGLTERRVVIYHGADKSTVTAKTLKVDVPQGDLPEDVRSELIRGKDVV
jgi:hypothetical protein